MKKKKNFWQRLFTKNTPVKYKRRAATFGILAATFTTSFGAVKILNIATPEYFDLFVGAVIFICSSVATYSQQKINPETK